MQWEGDAAEHGGACGGTAEQVPARDRMLSGGSWPRILLPRTSALNNGAAVSLFGKGNGGSVVAMYTLVLDVRVPEKPLVCQRASVLQTKGHICCQQTLSFLLFYFLHNCV